MEAKSIRVRIYGTDYPLRVDNEDFTVKAAGHLDKMMQELHAQIPDQPPTTLAVLSALNLSEELAHANEEKTLLSRSVEQELQSITQLIDGVLDEEHD
ncbi:MAG: cell division protein ZapA [Bacteroidetes bacterium]|nr:cell division protein ZapA [Bacteroidota bacterium]